MARRRALKLVKDPEERPQPRLTEIGASSFLPWSWFTQEEVYDYSRVSIDMLENMLDMDGQAQSIYRLLTVPLRASVLNVKPVTNGKAEADFIKQQFLNPPEKGGMQTPWPKVISQISHALLTGAEVFEKVYEIVNGNVVLTKIAQRQRRTLIFLKDDKGEFNGVKQILPGGPVPIPVEKCFRFMVGSEFNPMYGRSMFLPAYYHYEKKHKLYYTGHIAFAINATGIRIGEVPEDATEQEKLVFRKALEQVGFNSTIIKPQGFGVTIEKGGTVADMLPFVDHHDGMMAKGVLGQIIDIGTGANPGSFALSTTHLSLLLLAIEAIMGEISSEINTQIVPELIDWNFGTGRYPIVTLQPNYSDRRQVVQSIFERISSARQVNTTAEFWLEIEKVVAEQLGFEGEINYQANEADLLKEMRAKQNTIAGLTPDGKQKKPPKVPGTPGRQPPVVGPAPGTPGSQGNGGNQ